MVRVRALATHDVLHNLVSQRVLTHKNEKVTRLLPICVEKTEFPRVFAAETCECCLHLFNDQVLSVVLVQAEQILPQCVGPRLSKDRVHVVLKHWVRQRCVDPVVIEEEDGVTPPWL